jgi:ubiquinone/menaquinone biosynthesis C-methylase UbiE
MNEISDYDKLNYDYSQYWNERLYENLAEKNILNKIFSDKQGSWLIDIGGSYGRLASTYYDSYKNPLILDYSLKTLKRNKEIILSRYPKITLIAANAYKMPFKENVFDAGLMVRVLHHIENPEGYFKEAKRVLKPTSSYIQEFANKVHIKASIKALLKFNFGFFSQETYQQPIGKNLEGSKQEEGGIFLNYHPKYILQTLNSLGFKTEKVIGCSFLRSPFIKKIFPLETMSFLEKILQSSLSWTRISPSIFLETHLEEEKGESEEQNSHNLKDILACPECKSTLEFLQQDSISICKKCNREYRKIDGIWDFRVE